jgi:glutaredoxin
LLLGALAFEAVLFSYQVVVNPEPCIFCMGVLGGLTLIALLEMRENRLVPLALLGAIGVATGMLATVRNEAVLMQEGRYLFYSPTCPHCHKVRTYFKEHDIAYTPVDVSEASARRVLHYLGIDKIPVYVEKKAQNYRFIVGDGPILAHFETPEASLSVPPSASPSIPTEQDIGALLQSGADEGCTLSIVPEPSCSGEEKP